MDFNDQDSRLKPGLTANVNILTDSHQNALTIPVSALIKEGLQNYVIIDNQTVSGEKRAVTTGITSSDGSVEITSGLNLTDRIASFGNQQ